MPPKPSAESSSLAAISALGGGRGRPRKLDRATVTQAALDIVERDGLAGLTMRRAAERLGVGLATLYNAAGSKEAILDDMIEAVFGLLPEHDHTPGRELDSIVELWVATHELLVANPVVAQLIALRRFGGAGLFGLIESTLALLRDAGVVDGLITPAYETVRAYTLGFSLLQVSRRDPSAVAARNRLVGESASMPERYPQIVARTAELEDALTTDRFELGLRHLLEGFCAARP